jgi:hypothetical protein
MSTETHFEWDYLPEIALECVMGFLDFFDLSTLCQVSKAHRLSQAAAEKMSSRLQDEVNSNVSLFCNILEDLKDTMVAITQDYEDTGYREGDQMMMIYQDASACFDGLRSAFPESFLVEFQDNDGNFYEFPEEVDEDWNFDDYDEEIIDVDGTLLDEKAYLNHIPQLRITLQGSPGYKLILYVTLDGNNNKHFWSHIVYQGRGMDATFLVWYVPGGKEQWDYGKFLKKLPPAAHGVMGVTPGCHIKNQMCARDADWAILRKVFNLDDEVVSFIQENQL